MDTDLMAGLQPRRAVAPSTILSYSDREAFNTGPCPNVDIGSYPPATTQAEATGMEELPDNAVAVNILVEARLEAM